ncbi:hypothetical protein M011DRAFT_509319 [Sporormia fimetaria CBS 119925]|uniref:Uncharacterized protein n=1 Tax=Sporormia fimetaria CBS 119925 TaxID=1340428 RepID=A0A6A6VHF5_9PLEO|nr:hypothetical protein M011DRAFT_509319 [Sporormia fimetaria CBS 119925]
MATESDPAVTRVTIILDKPDDWFNWLFIRQDIANRHGLWQYIDPDVAKETLPVLTEPPEPQLTDYKAGATKLSELPADDRESYRWECDRWERRRTLVSQTLSCMRGLYAEVSRNSVPFVAIICWLRGRRFDHFASAQGPS